MPASRPKQTTEGRPRRKNPMAVALGKLGASKGGIARAKKLTPERRREIAREAIAARWAKHKQSTKRKAP